MHDWTDGGVMDAAPCLFTVNKLSTQDQWTNTGLLLSWSWLEMPLFKGSPGSARPLRRSEASILVQEGACLVNWNIIQYLQSTDYYG